MTEKNINRRDFVKSTAVLGSSFLIANASSVKGSQANSKIEVGVIGLGGRGSLIAGFLKEHAGYQITAVADYFPEVSTRVGEELGVEKSRRFSGLLGYQRLIDSGVDAAFLETPPYAFPDHVEYAVQNDCHVYMAKPIACDAPGTLRVLANAEKATANGKVFLIDYQMRTDPVNIEIIKRIREGQIGDFGLVHSIGFGNGFLDPPRERSMASRLQNLAWVPDDALGGGNLVNYDIHAIDAGLWIADGRPVSAMGSSRMVVNNSNSDSHRVSSVTLQFENGVIMNHISEHFRNVNDGALDAYVYGTEGYAETKYWGKAILRSNLGAHAGEMENLYNNGILRNLDTFHQSIIKGDVSNSTVQSGVNSNLAAILAREAAKRNGLMSMEQLIEENVELEVDYTGLVE